MRDDSAGYRWNSLENARGYDAAAEHVHPYYREIQDVLLETIDRDVGTPDLVADLGGGSGRLAERILERWPASRVVVIDQSDSFLELARERLDRFGERVRLHRARLQEEWHEALPENPNALVSMSAVHHLDPGEKCRFYRQCADSLAPGGILLNGDEVRPEHDNDYLAECRRWSEHMRHAIAAGRIPHQLHRALAAWEERNVRQFGQPRVSGDDCHETAAAQRNYLAQAGLLEPKIIWQREMWAVLAGSTPRGT